MKTMTALLSLLLLVIVVGTWRQQQQTDLRMFDECFSSGLSLTSVFYHHKNRNPPTPGFHWRAGRSTNRLLILAGHPAVLPGGH